MALLPPLCVIQINRHSFLDALHFCDQPFPSLCPSIRSSCPSADWLVICRQSLGRSLFSRKSQGSYTSKLLSAHCLQLLSLCPCLCLFDCLRLCPLNLTLPLSTFIHISLSISLYPSIYVGLSVCLSACLCLSVDLFVFPTGCSLNIVFFP